MYQFSCFGFYIGWAVISGLLSTPYSIGKYGYGIVVYFLLRYTTKEFQAVWPDLAKIHQIVMMLKNFGQFGH